MNRNAKLAQVQAALGHPVQVTDAQALDELITGTAEVQVTIVTTVNVPTVNGKWTKGDAVRAAAWSVNEGNGHFEAHEVEPTGAPTVPGEVCAHRR